MTNKEWLEEVKKNDENIVAENFYNNCEYRQAKALEIIAEELIKLNEFYAHGLDVYARVKEE